MSEVAVGGGGVSKLQTKSEVLCFFCLLNLSLNKTKGSIKKKYGTVAFD